MLNTKIFKKYIWVLLGLFVLQSKAQTVSIIPKPTQIKVNKESFEITQGTNIVYDQSNKNLARIADLFSTYVEDYYNIKLSSSANNDGFDFLGFNIRKYKNGVLIIKPSKDSQKNFQEKIKQVINANKSIPQVSLIRLLNPIIRGWGNYYQHCSAAEVFQNMVFHIFQKLLQWSLRRHPVKGKKWVVNKYFHNYNGKSWTFASPYIKKGKNELFPIYRLPDIKITRYAKIKYDANPYDPKWKGYFEEYEPVSI